MEQSEKQRLRQELAARRLALAADWAEEAAERAALRLLQRPEWKARSRIGLYWPHRGEISTLPAIHGLKALGHQVFLPRVEAGELLLFGTFDGESELKAGPFGVLEPSSSRLLPAQELSALVLPGLAFDTRGARIGWGQGYYDRALRGFTGFRVGLAFDFQVLDHVPCEAHDERVQLLITERRAVEVGRGKEES